MEFFLIWLYFFLSNLSVLAAIGLIIIGVCSAIGLIITLFYCAELGESPAKVIGRLPCKKLWAILMITLVVLATAVPNKDQMAWIVGGGVVLKVGQNEEVQKLPENTVKAVNRFLNSISEDEKK